MSLDQWMDNNLQSKKLVILTVMLVILYIMVIGTALYFTNKFHISIQSYMFDLRWMYSAHDVYQTLSILDPFLIKLYPIIAVCDSICALFYAVVGALLFRKIVLITTKNKFLYRLPYLFLFAGFFDLLENIALSILFFFYPLEFFWLANLSNIFTMLKYLFLISGILFSISLLVYCRIGDQA